MLCVPTTTAFPKDPLESTLWKCSIGKFEGKKVKCSANDSWSPGAYIRMLGPDGQLLYIGVMTQHSEEKHDFYRKF